MKLKIIFLFCISLILFSNFSESRIFLENENYYVEQELEKGWNLVAGISFSEKLHEDSELNLNAIWKSFYHNAETNEDVEIRPNYQVGNVEPLSFYANAFWVFSAKGGTLIYKVSPSFISPERLGGAYEFFKGDNLIAINDLIYGKSLEQIKGDCEISDASYWDAEKQNWTSISLNKKINFKSQDELIGEGIRIKVEDNCEFLNKENEEDEKIEINDINLSISTTKNYYSIGEPLTLTDPPDKDVEAGSLSVGVNAWLEDTKAVGSEAIIQGYFVELKEEPLIEVENKVETQLKNIEEKSIDKSIKADEGVFFLKPIREFQANSLRKKYSKVKDESFDKIKEAENNIKSEHIEVKADLRDFSNEIVKEYKYIFNGFLVDVSEEDADSIAMMENVKAVYPNYLINVSLDSAIPALKLDLLRDSFGVTGEGVTIAVIDTGIDASHESLDDLDDDSSTEDIKVIGFKDYINFRNEPYDDHGHGTHVSGIAAGTGGGGKYIGVAPGAKLVGVKVLSGEGRGSFDGVISGIEWVIQNKDKYGIDIISMSLGANYNSDGTTPVEKAVDYAVAQGINVVVAGGNSGPRENSVGIPASAFDVITVGAVDDNLEIASFSSRGPTKDGRLKPDVSAVGVEVTSSIPGGNDNYDSHSGTSMATPMVSGDVALLLEAKPNLSPREVKDLLTRTVIDKGEEGPDNNYGHGVINALLSYFELNPPEHEVGISNVDLLSYMIVGEEFEINTEVINYGLNDESFDVFLLVNGIEESRSSVELLAKENKKIKFSYTPEEEKSYSIEIKISNVEGDLLSSNNEFLGDVNASIVEGKIKAVVLDSWGNYVAARATIFDELNENWFNYGNYLVEIDYDSLMKEDISYEDIVNSGADVLIISNAWANGQRGMNLQFTDEEISAIKKYTEEGHGLIGTAGTLSELVENNIGLAELFGIKEAIGLWNSNDAELISNLNIFVDDGILTKDIPTSYVPVFIHSVINLELDESKDVVRVASGEEQDDVFVSAYKSEKGASVYFTYLPEIYYQEAVDRQFFYNSIVWTNLMKGEKGEKDVSISDIKLDDEIIIGEETVVSAKVVNHGLDNEEVVVKFSYDDEEIESKTLNVLSGDIKEFNFSFVPGNGGEHLVSLEVLSLTDESYLVNNKIRNKILVKGALIVGHSEKLIDLNSDGKFEFLNVSFELDVKEKSFYSVLFDLTSFLGAGFGNYRSWEFELDKGMQNVSAIIYLPSLKKYELNGPYKISNIVLIGQGKNGNIIVDSFDEIITQAYKYESFTDNSKIIPEVVDYGVDLDGDGLYDELVVNISVNVSIPGEYELSSSLDFGTSSSYDSNKFEALTPGIYNVSLVYDGVELRKARVKGEILLREISLSYNFIGERVDVVNDVVLQNEYSYEQFEKFNNIEIGGIHSDFMLVGEESKLVFSLRNTGSEDFGEFDVVLFSGDEEIGRQNIEGIEVNSFADVEFEYTSLQEGLLELSLVAEVEDDNLEDNRREFSVRVMRRGADLDIYSNVWDKIYIIGEESSIDFSIGNNGLEKAEDVVVSLYNIEREWIKNPDTGEYEEKENRTLLESKNLDDIEANNWIDDSLEYTPVSKYDNLLLIVESSNEVWPGNNKMEFNIRAITQDADLDLGFVYDDSYFVEGVSKEIKVRVRNIGVEEAKDVTINLYKQKRYYSEEIDDWVEEDILIDSKNIESITSLEGREIIFNYVPEDNVGDYVQLKAEGILEGDLDVENNVDRFSKIVVPQSKIVNNGNESVNGKVVIKVQEKVDEQWEDVEGIFVEENVDILSGDLIKLDKIFNPEEFSIDSAGEYRIFVEFVSSVSSYRKDASWEFGVD